MFRSIFNSGYVFTLATLFTTLSLTTLSAQQNDRALGGVDDRTSGNMVRASKLIGMNLYNTNNENVGEIKDLVVDSRSGRIEYVAVTYGGFLGLGNKMFAVPFDAIKYEVPANNADSNHRLILNVTKQQMEGAVGFDEDHWPNFADQNFTDELYRRYRIERRRTDGTRAGVDIRADRNGVDINVNK